MNKIHMPSGDYAVLSQLRKTGSKVLYLARNEHTGQQVVLCKLLEHIDVYSLLQLVTHKNLVRVLDVETQSSGITYVIMEYIDAPLLSDAMSQRPFAQREVLRIGIQLCAALHALHSVGLIHRDVKPENVFLLPDGTVKLFDYDASRIFKAAIGSDTTPMGTFGYAAPEQFGLKQSDARSDIYALGILLNMLAVGEHPSVRLCKGGLRRIVLRCTHVSPEKRYRNASQVQHALQSCLLQRWTAPAAIAAVLAVFILLVLPSKRSPDLSVPSSAPSPAFPAPTMTTNPIPSSVLTPTPSPTQYQTLSNLPPEFENGMSSVREITLDGNTYYLFLSTEDAEQFSPRFDATERRVYFSEGDEMTLYLYVWPSDGDLDKLSSIRSRVNGVSYTIESQYSSYYTTLAMDGFGLYPDDSSTLLARGYFISSRLPSVVNNRSHHHLVTVSVEFDDGKIIPLHLSVTVHPDEITLTHGSLYPMATTEQLNELLQSLDELFGPEAPITLQLPASDYAEEVVIPGRSVSLIGTAEETVFRNGLRIDESEDSNMVFIQSIVFQGDGSGTAIASQRNLSLSQCTFNNYDTCYTVPENIIVTGHSITGNVPFAEAAQPTTPDLTTAAGLNAYLSNPPGELANLPSYTIQLPAVTYTEEIVINRAVSLEGAPNRKTVFLAGLRYEGEGGDVLVRNCTFHCDGREAAVVSSRNLQITECNICDFTYAAMPIGDAKISFLDCNFDMTDYLLPGSNSLKHP